MHKKHPINVRPLQLGTSDASGTSPTRGTYLAHPKGPTSPTLGDVPKAQKAPH